MYRQHFGLSAAPLANDRAELWDDGVLARLEERFQWLLQSPGIGQSSQLKNFSLAPAVRFAKILTLS